MIGYLQSTSFAAPALLGDRLQDFDDTVRLWLPQFATNGVYVDENEFDILLARRPRSAGGSSSS